MRAALVQLTSGDDPDENARTVAARIAEAAQGGAELVLTPEVTNCVSLSRSHQRAVLRPEAEDATLAAARKAARAERVWAMLGSIAVTTDDPEGRFANRSILIDPEGHVTARYDKIHMFDVHVDDTETYRESAGFRPGDRAVLAEAAGTRIGMSICYDMRFPALYRHLARAGAQVLTVPAAFTVPTGRAHWHALLRARAIETGCFVLAPAQTGTHPGSGRRTFGHSLAVSPWGEVLADGGEECGVTFVDLDLAEVDKARARIPSLAGDRAFTGP
ncbi:MAG: carbon-nitrogen hydrolase family protein [Shimia sp.]